MLNNLLDKLKSKFELEYITSETTKVSGMNFIIKQYYGKGLGNISTMEAIMPFGLMEMNSLIINPFEIDLPLLSCDRVKSFGKYTLYLEIYETRIDSSTKPDFIKDLIKLNNEYSFKPKPAWYDNIRYSESIYMKTKRKDLEIIDKTINEFLNNYLKWSSIANKCDINIKIKEARKYCEGLLEHGGPSTDTFIKNKGRDYTNNLYRNILFGTK